MKGGYVYILASERNGALYIGVTKDLKRRIWEHKDHAVIGFTQKYNVTLLVWFEEYDSIEGAIHREGDYPMTASRRDLSRHHASAYDIVKVVIVAFLTRVRITKGYMMGTQTTIHDVSAWFLDKETMSQKKLQKLCYYAVAWGYALLDKPIVKNPEFEAWVHGPVSKALWNTYASYGWEPISKKTKTWADLTAGKLSDSELPANVGELLEAVWATYGSKSGLELEALSHKEMPWIKARKGLPEFERSSEAISPEDMRAYYRSIYIQ